MTLGGCAACRTDATGVVWSSAPTNTTTALDQAKCCWQWVSPQPGVKAGGQGRQCHAESWPFALNLTRQQLAVDARKIAFEASLDLFQRVGWESTTETLEGVLNQCKSTVASLALEA